MNAVGVSFVRFQNSQKLIESFEAIQFDIFWCILMYFDVSNSHLK